MKIVLQNLMTATLFITPLTLFAESPETPVKARVSEAVLRTEGPLNHMKLNGDKNLVAYVDGRGQSLRVLDFDTGDVMELTPHRVGDAFFWSPDKSRLFYRELSYDEKRKVKSSVKAFDMHSRKTITLDEHEGSTGFLTLDPRDFTFYMMHEKGISNRRLEFPGERFARWQERSRKTIDLGRFVATQKSVLWLSDLGLTLSKLQDDDSGVESFDISPDGTTIAWATNKAQIYVSELGGTPKHFGPGRDPRWHETRPLLVYSGGRVIGDRVYDYDIKISDRRGRGRFLTQTQGIKERWPQWWKDGTLIHTRDGTTDLWQIPYRNDEEMTAKSSTSEKVKESYRR